MSGNFSLAADFAVGVAVAFPAVVDVDVLEPVGGQAAADHGVGRGADLGVAHGAGPAVPGVPAHGRRQRQLVLAADDGQLAAGPCPGRFRRSDSPPRSFRPA